MADMKYLRFALTEFLSLVAIIAFLSAVLVWAMAIPLMTRPACSKDLFHERAIVGYDAGLGHPPSGANRMRRFALFVGTDYYPAGGWDDFHSAYDTKEEARAAGERIAGLRHNYDWWHVVDLTIGDKVAD